MNFRRRDYILTFTILGLAAGVLMGFQYLGAHLYALAELWADNQGAGGFRWLSWLFHSPWTDMLVRYLFAIGAAYPFIWLMLCRIPKFETRAYRISFREFMLCLVAAMGIGYAFNLMGAAFNAFVSLFSGKTLAEMNPVVEMTSDLTPSMVVYICILGPFMEELMFRGMLLKRARRFGDRTAVVYTALLFGLMHGNISQFLYAAFIGLVFGYVAVKTDSIRYTVPMHMAINSYNTAIALGEEFLYDAGLTGLAVLYDLAFLAAIVMLIIGGVVIMKKYGRFCFRQLTWNNGPPSPFKKYVYLNPGFFLFLAISLFEMAFYLL